MFYSIISKTDEKYIYLLNNIELVNITLMRVFTFLIVLSIFATLSYCQYN